MTFVTMSLVVEDEFDDASAGLSVIMEEESCASSMFTEPADDTGTLALMEVTATRDYNNEDYSDEKWFPLLAPSPVIGSSKPMPPNPTAMPIVETKGTAARLFEYKKKLAIVWRRLEKAERRFLQVQETTCKAPLSPPPPREEPPNIPVKITVETTDACEPPAEDPPLPGDASGEVMNDEEQPVLEAEVPEKKMPDAAPIRDTKPFESETNKRKDVLEYVLDSLGVDKMCGLDDATVFEAAVAAQSHRQRLKPPVFVVPVSSPLPLPGSPDRGSPDEPVLVTPTSSDKECRASREVLAHKAVFWSKKLVHHQQKERRRLMIQSDLSSFSAIDPFRNGFDDEHEALEVFDQLASLCDPLEFEVDE